MYNKTTHFHFIGIGGIGMSGIAKILIQRGYTVSGCDKNIAQQSVNDLQTLGCKISGEHNSALCQTASINVMVYSSDIANDNPEFEYARRNKIPLIHRATVLAELTKQAYTIAVAGSHGKTTTTSLIAHILLKTQYDPSVIVGGYIHDLQSNAHNGNSRFLVAETDESDRSLVHLFPTIAVLTNIDLEHMNIYQNLHDITATFGTFLKKLPFYGTSIMCYDDAAVRTLLPLTNTHTLTYGITELSNNTDFTLEALTLYPTHSTYTLKVKQTGEYYPVMLNIPGEHNAANSLAALAAAYQIGIPLNQAAAALATFTGVDRRFTYKGKFRNLEIFDDYGHHPTEIACTLKNARRYAGNRPLTMVFQPHRYTRTHLLWDDFIKLFSTTPIDNLIITDIYAAHEPIIANISSKRLVKIIKQANPDKNIFYAQYEQHYTEILEYIQTAAQNEGVLLIQGAGPVTGFANFLTQ